MRFVKGIRKRPLIFKSIKTHFQQGSSAWQFAWRPPHIERISLHHLGISLTQQACFYKDTKSQFTSVWTPNKLNRRMSTFFPPEAWMALGRLPLAL